MSLLVIKAGLSLDSYHNLLYVLLTACSIHNRCVVFINKLHRDLTCKITCVLDSVNMYLQQTRSRHLSFLNYSFKSPLL